MNKHTSKSDVFEKDISSDGSPQPPLRVGVNRFWKRLGLFVSVFIFCAAVSLVYTFIRPPIYESSADLLIEPKNPDNRGQDTSAYDIALQKQVLLSRDLLTRVSENIPATAYPDDIKPLTFSSLRPMLHVTTQTDSAIVRLKAEGPRKDILPIIVNSWVDRYVDMNSQMQKSYSDTTTTSLEQQIETLEDKIKAKRAELERFRDKFDIVTLERDGNKALSTLKGLHASLNKATENRINAEANLQAVQNAIEQGKWAGNYKKTTELLRLEEKAETMEEQVRNYETRYTSQFLEIDKSTRSVIDKYHRLKEEIEVKYSELKKAALEEAEQRIESARNAEDNLKKQIAAYEKDAAEFSSRYSEYESLTGDLQGLEALNRNYQKELVAMEIKSDSDMLQVKVLERAFLPDAPSRPNYLRDAAISIFGSLLLAIVAVLLFDLLVKPVRQQDEKSAYAVTYNQVFQSSPPSLPDAAPNAMQKKSLLPPVEQLLPRELSDEEIKRLYISSDDMTRRLISGLISGLSLEEAVRLKWDDVNFDKGELKVSGDAVRTVPLTSFHRSVLIYYRPAAATSGKYVLENEEGGPFTSETIEDLIFQAARQAQIQNPQQITSQALRHTYISFLARQGVPLNEIEGILGGIPAHHYTAYQIMVPPGAGISIENAQHTLPALQEFI